MSYVNTSCVDLEDKELRFKVLATKDEGVAMQLLHRRSIGLSLQLFPDLSPTMKRGNWKTFPAFPVGVGLSDLELRNRTCVVRIT